MSQERSTEGALFAEDQRFRQPWLWALLIGIFLVVGGSMGWGLLSEPEKVGRSVLPVVGSVALWGGVCLFMLMLRLDVQVDDRHLHVRFFPLLWKKIPLEDIARWEARTYRPLLEYGGWGIRYALGRGWAYNVSGNQGVQLELVNGKRILIGSQRPEELAAAISRAKGQG